MFSRLFEKFLKIAWFLPGFLLWAAYPPMGERMDCLFALAPLMWLARREVNAGIVAKRWFQSGIFYWVATLSWMPAIVKNGGPWPLVVLGWFALSAYCSLYFWLYGWLSAKYWRWARNSNTQTLQNSNTSYWKRLLGILMVEPILWCGLELVRSRFLGGFAWNQLGVVPVNSGFGAPAALGGVYLCSAVVILINGTIAGIIERMWKPERSGFANLKRWGSVETLLAFGVVWGIYAANVLTMRIPKHHPDCLKVAMVQRNFPCVFKAQDERPQEVYERLLGNVAALRPDLVVLPESAMCEFGAVDQQGAVRFAEWVAKKTGGAALLAGGTRHEDGKTYNSAALYRVGVESNRVELGSGRVGVELIQIYDKVHLVPFGEFIPGDKWITALQKLAPVGSCTAGELKTLGDCGVAICFEDTDSAQMRELAKKGARALFFITNDSWFSQSIEAEQHAWQAVARAIETGLPVVRVGNSGVTGTITRGGKASWLVGTNGKPLVDKEGTMFDRIEVKDGRRKTEDADLLTVTPYVVFGDWPLGIAFALLILSMILVKYKAHHEQRRTLSL